MRGDLEDAAQLAMAAALSGGVARVLMALYGGARGWMLALEAGLGAMLGVMAAGAAVWWDPGLREVGWPLLVVASIAGTAGAIGTRLLDLVVAEAQRRAGG